jgi:hypothetical protein
MRLISGYRDFGYGVHDYDIPRWFRSFTNPLDELPQGGVRFPIGSVFNFNGDSLGANIMTLLALVLLLFGVAYCLIGSIQLLIVMFRESIWWGLAQLLVPATHLLFMCLHFKEAWPPIKKCLVGSLCVVVTLFLPLNGEIVTGFRPNTAPLRELWNSYINDATRPSHQTADNGGLSFQTVGDYKGKTLIQGKGEVSRILADDREGSKHQRFILRFASGRTLLVAHNIDVGRRINGIKVGDQVEFFGEYASNAEGGVVHWTHRDLKGRHPDGWLRHHGITYQ